MPYLCEARADSARPLSCEKDEGHVGEHEDYYGNKFVNENEWCSNCGRSAAVHNVRCEEMRLRSD